MIVVTGYYDHYLFHLRFKNKDELINNHWEKYVKNLQNKFLMNQLLY